MENSQVHKRLLSSREMEIAGLVHSGFTNREIADELEIRPVTARNQITILYRKLGIGTRVELALLLERGLLRGKE